MQDNVVFERVAAMAFAAFNRLPDLLLVYSEVEDGVWSADLFAQVPGSRKIVHKHAPRELGRLIYEYWETGNGMVHACSWATFQMVIEGSQFKLEFGYPADLKEDEDLLERRSRLVGRVFVGQEIDYSNPGR